MMEMNVFQNLIIINLYQMMLQGFFHHVIQIVLLVMAKLQKLVKIVLNVLELDFIAKMETVYVNVQKAISRIMLI